MVRIVLFTLLFIKVLDGFGQSCNLPQFSILDADKLCINSPVKLSNQTANASHFYWEFCPENFSETPVNANTQITGFSNGYGYKLVEQNGLWYGFLTSRTLDKLFRLDFGNDPANPPVTVDLGNPGGLMDAPEGIDLYKDESTWFAFVGKGENGTGQIVKFNFGNDLTSIPTATGYGTFGLGSIRIRDLSIVNQGSDIILLLLLYNTQSINRVNFGSSLENVPAPNNVIAIAGASLPRGLSVVTNCNPWRAHIVSENGLIQQVSFGNDVLGPVMVEGSYSFPSVSQPWKIKSIYNAGKYHAIISNNNRKYSMIDFGDLSLLMAPVEVPNNNDVRYIGIDVVKYRGRSMLQGAGSGGSLFSVSYQSVCGLLSDYSYDKDPLPFTSLAGGSLKIDLRAFSNETGYADVSKEIQIMEKATPLTHISYVNVCAGRQVNFVSSNNDLLSSWDWTLGNGETSTLTSPGTVYITPGIYDVTLEAEGLNGCMTGDNVKIKIYDAPQSEFFIPPGLLCTNNPLTFINATPDLFDGKLAYQWFVNNNPTSTERDLRHTFTTTLVSEIKLVTTIPGCSDEVSRITPTIESGPVVNFSSTGTCEDAAFNFRSEISDPVEKFLWDFSDGNISGDPDPVNIFSEFGEYLISLTATNAIGCENVKIKTISVHSKPLIDFQVGGASNACSGTPTLFQNQSSNPDSREISNWLWNFGYPRDGMIQREVNPEHKFKVAGTYLVSLTASTSLGCEATREKEITIMESPSTDYESSPACDDLPVVFNIPSGNDIIDHYWEIGTAYYLIPSPTHTFKSPGDYPLYLEVTSANGCTSSVTNVVHVPVPLSPDFSVLKNCVNQEAIFTDITTGVDPVATREWNFADNEIYSDSQVRYTFKSQGNKNVTLKVTTASGCNYHITKQVPIVPSPVAGFSALPTSGAYPLEVTFTNSSAQASHYLWKIDGTDATTTNSSPVFTFQQLGTFNVELTAFNEQQCLDSFQTLITTVAPLPDVELEIITLTPNPDGSSKLIVTIHNKGNTVLKDLPVDIDFGGKIAVRQNVDVPIFPGAKYNLVFKTGILDLQNLSYLCASVDLQNDLYPIGNRICNELTNTLFAFPAYPNPTNSTLNVEWIGNSNGTVRISLADALGKQIFLSDTPLVSGFNHLAIDVRRLQNGIYYLLIEDGATKNTQRILISTHP